MRAKEFITESTFQEHEEQLRDFIQWCVRKLNIQQELPRIRFQDAKEGPDQHRTGYYDDNDDIMWVYTGNRNLIDIMRTVAHELVHRKQHEDNKGKTLVSEGIDANYQDMINYSVFALILMKNK